MVVVITTYWVQVVVVTGDDNYNRGSDYRGVDCVEGVIKIIPFLVVRAKWRAGSDKNYIFTFL